MTRRLKRELVPAVSDPASMASAAMVSTALSQAPSRTTMALALPSPGSNTPKKYSAWVMVERPSLEFIVLDEDGLGEQGSPLTVDTHDPEVEEGVGSSRERSGVDGLWWRWSPRRCPRLRRGRP